MIPARIDGYFQSVCFILFVAAILILNAAQIQAKEYRFALVPKATDKPFFWSSQKGCVDAAKALKYVTCLYEGSKEFDFRLQNEVIERLIEQQVDGIALSVTHSNFLVRNSIHRARLAGIPVVTFDSDFDARDLIDNPGIRKSYIGTDNFAMGIALGNRLMELKPGGGRVCIISGRVDTPNLQQRVRGIRAALSGHGDQQDEYKLNQRLSDAGAWREHSRCPFHTRERPNFTLSQMQTILSEVGVNPDAADALIVVGLWPQQSENYASVIGQFKDILDRKEIIVLMSDTLPFQLPYIDLGYSHSNIGQHPYSMGYKAMETLYEIVQNRPVDEIIYTPLTDCRPGNTKYCIE